ncbi:hypothetical protein P0D88_48255, partial [Paraburkholderia sp. RL18-103-BIB-C]|uniref:hypothetical protein n=1 Tax=unclassified Paraburkholderia TaxID=2615204 RepID=UPI0038BBB6A0
VMSNFRETTPKFREVKAYAKRHRRVVPVIGTTIQLSLQESALNRLPLRRCSCWSTAVHSAWKCSVQWCLRCADLHGSFRKSRAAAVFEFTTFFDGIEVTLSSEEEPAVTPEPEERLRGIAARLATRIDVLLMLFIVLLSPTLPGVNWSGTYRL